MTPDEARQRIIALFQEIQSSGLEVRIDSDYGSDDRIEIWPSNSNGAWKDIREIRWRDYDDFDD